MACITGDTSNIFINNGNLVMSQDVFANTIHFNTGSSSLTGSQDGLVISSNTVTLGTITANSFITGSSSLTGTSDGLIISSNIVALGTISMPNVRNNTVIGYQAGHNDSSFYNSVVVGNGAGQTGVNFQSVSVGYHAGNTEQGFRSVAIGCQAGNGNQFENCVSVGFQSGFIEQAASAVAIGYQAGYRNQGESSIAIGFQAGYQYQAPNTTILNATSNPLNGTTPDAFYVAPIRSSTSCQMLGYDSANCEVLQTSSVTVLNSNVGVSNTSPGHPFVVGASNLVVGTNGHIGINTVPNNAQVTIVNSSGTQTALAISGASNQNAYLQTWVNNTGSLLASVSGTGGMTLAGSLSRKGPITVSQATYTVQDTDTWIIADVATFGDVIQLILPDPSTCPGREIGVRKGAPGNHAVTSASPFVYNMDGGTNGVIIQATTGYHTSAYLVSDGNTKWVMTMAL